MHYMFLSKTLYLAQNMFQLKLAHNFKSLYSHSETETDAVWQKSVVVTHYCNVFLIRMPTFIPQPSVKKS